MSTLLVTASPDDEVLDVAAAMVHAVVRHIPIVDNEGEVVGMVSDRDIRALIGDPIQALCGGMDEVLEPVPVEVIMTKNPICVPPTMPLEEAARWLLQNRIGALVVSDEHDQLVGVVTTADLLHHAFIASAYSTAG